MTSSCFRAAVAVLFATVVFAKPVEFEFKVPDNPQVKNPFAREVSAEVITPSARKVVLPAFYEGGDTYAVRARPDELGTYHMGKVVEMTAGNGQELQVRMVSVGTADVKSTVGLPSIGRDPANTLGFADAQGRPFVPTGANVAWPSGSCVPYYREAFAKFGAANLNWMRVWMAHWGSLDLDWLPKSMGASPPPGFLDARIAANWDKLLELAEANGVYVQVVLQHHGQFTTVTNPNWNENPWNAANQGGFLRTPTEFFTQPTARSLTKQKYRYIVARWGWSPAVFAWELFNEVHWVDAIAKDKNEAAVAAWHNEMADYLRTVDVYRHLITTSTDNVRSPIYERMDFYQPHLYPADLILGARSYAFGGKTPDRPVFYGEQGDDHLDASAAVKKSGVALVPPAWAGLFGQSRIPAQPWLGATILEQNRTSELGAIQRFVVLSRFANQRDLVPFSAAIESTSRVPLELHGTQVWQRRAAPELEVPLDGRLPLELADIPRMYVGLSKSVADGFPDRATFHVDFPRATTLRAKVVGCARAEAGIALRVDGKVAATKSWTKDAPSRPTPAHPVELTANVDAGKHTIVCQNTGAGDWVEVASIDLGFDTATLAAIGQRSPAYIALWVWNRTGVLAVEAVPPASGTIVIDDVPAGEWTATWWDTTKGAPMGAPQKISHPGGTLRIATPPIGRHAAVVLTTLR